MTISPNPLTHDADDGSVVDDDDKSVDDDDDDDDDGEHSNMSKSAHYCSASFSKTGPSCRLAVGYTTQSTFS